MSTNKTRPSKDRFANIIKAALQKAGYPSGLHYDRKEFCLVGQDGAKHWLQNTYAEYCPADPDLRTEILRTRVRAWIQSRHPIPNEYEDVRPDIRPAILNRFQFEIDALENRDADRKHQVIGNDLVACLVYDLPECLRFFGQSRLDDWNVSFDDALEDAKRNLAEVSSDTFTSIAPGTWQSPWQDGYDAARLLLPDKITSLEVNGDPVALAPSRDWLLVTGSDDTEGLACIAKKAATYNKKPYPLMNVALRLQNGQWTRYTPVSSPLKETFEDLARLALGTAYNTHGKALQASYEATGNDTYVAPFMVVSKPNNPTFSATVWTKGIRNLLPRTDVISFVDASRFQVEVPNCPWDKAKEVVRSLIAPVAGYPERFLVTEYPTPEQLVELREASKDHPIRRVMPTGMDRTRPG